MKPTSTTVNVVLAAALVLAVFGIVRLAGCPSGKPGPQAPAIATQSPTTSTGGTDPDDETGTAATPIERLLVMVYYPAVEADGLVGEVHQIFNTAAPGDRAKQIVADLISGPTTELALRAIPPGTQLRQIFVLDDGTAFVDLSKDFEQAIGGGSGHELLAVYSIVNSLALNIPDIKRVGILINGRPVETLNGHMDLRRPLPPDTSFISDEIELTIVRNSIARDEADG